jgi:hypothetical protein
VRFPPHKQVSATLISDKTYFKMKKDGVLVSLKAWIGDIEPYDTLEEIWVQVSGIPPKWTNWRTLRQLASFLGKLLEVDWNSLFTSFFSLVRIKIACKDAFKIPRKRLFEMKNNLYLVCFKLEPKAGLMEDDDVNGDDQDDPRNEEEDGIEEFDQDMDLERRADPGEKKVSRNSAASGSKSTLAPSGSKKLMDWVSLFQDSEDTMKMENSELAQYSCSRLLRDMEAAEVESEEEFDSMCLDDELATLPAEWTRGLDESREDHNLPENLYILPKLKKEDVDLARKDEDPHLDRKSQKEAKKKWGSVLVEKRTTRNPRDGRTMREKAQERKNVVNLEGHKGITKSSNPFSVLSSEDITRVAKDVGVSLGEILNEISSSVAEMQTSVEDRDDEFILHCSQCQLEKESDECDPDSIVEKGDHGNDLTPIDQPIHPQMEGSMDIPGQWTLVANKKNSKSRLTK